MQSQIQLPVLTKVNKILIIVFVAFFVLNGLFSKVFGFHLANVLGLSGSMLAKGHLYQLFTYSLVSRGIVEVIFECLILWFIGSELESLWGPRKFIGFILTAAIGGGLIFAIISTIFFTGSSLHALPLSGPAGIVGAICMCFGILFPERIMYFFFFPVKAKWFVLFLIGMNLYQGLFSPAGVFAWGPLGCYLSAFCWMVGMSNPKVQQMLKEVAQRKKKKPGAHLRIVKDDSDDDITYH